MTLFWGGLGYVRWKVVLLKSLYYGWRVFRLLLFTFVMFVSCYTILFLWQDKLNLSCLHSPMVSELMRGIRSQMEGLITGLPSREMAAMCLGLAHR